MLTLPTIIGLIWLASSFICLLIIPFIVLIWMIRKKCRWFKIILLQLILWYTILAFIYFVFGGPWFVIGIIGPTLSIG